MSKRTVEGSEKLAMEEEEEDVNMVDATSGITETSSKRGQPPYDYSSLIDTNEVEASQSQQWSYVGILEKAYNDAKSTTEDWKKAPETSKSISIYRKFPSTITAETDKWLCSRIGRFLEIREKMDLADPGPDLPQDSAESAFRQDYESHEDDLEFIRHLEEQRKIFLQRKKESVVKNAPFFAVIQSSGYGKSRLVTHLKDHPPENYQVVYWTFSSKKAYPSKNVTIEESDFSKYPRIVLENALNQEICVALNRAIAGENPVSVSPKISPLLTETKPPAISMVPTGQKKIIFVVDEASWLLDKFTSDGVSFYRALRAVFKTFTDESEWLFFVVMSTFSSITYLSPEDPSWKPCSRYDDENQDSSFKPYAGYDDNNQKPLKPFILGSSFRVNNDRDTLLAKNVEACHDPLILYSMGRPLWKALLTCKMSLAPSSLLDYAIMKLRNSMESDFKLAKKEELLAALSVRLCLSISPTSLYAPSLVACHMGTALSVSEDRMSMTVTYPSEPVLAVAARKLMNNAENIQQMISTLNEFLAFGVVDKGYKGELIVRLLMTLAMDKAMGGGTVKGVQLKDYLKQFNRKDANLGTVIDKLETSGLQEINVENELAILKRLGLDWSDSQALLEAKKQNQSSEASRYLTYLDGEVCFTHFVYLSKSIKGPLITHDLLRYAYRRTAAIVVEEGRRGIDKVIPLRVKKDTFVGVVVQDKNRVSDTLQSLTGAENATTHHKANVEYFLTNEEKETFKAAGVDLAMHWPAILFAIGVDEVGAGVATQFEQKRFRHNYWSETERFDFPCIVLTGLNYRNIMNEDADASLKRMRALEDVPTEQKQADIPMTYGG